MPNILKVVQAGDPVLRRRARAFTPEQIRSPEFARLVEDMRETMRDAPGVGLAAPQIGRSLQVFVIEDRSELIERLPSQDAEARGRVAIPFQVLVNPRLTFVDRTPAEFFEGCLSFADFMMVVPRAHAVRVDALDHQANAVAVTFTGWPARILQHEMDHLLGVLCIDRMRSRTLTSTRNHTQHWHDEPIAAIIESVGNSPETDALPDPPLADEGV